MEEKNFSPLTAERNEATNLITEIKESSVVDKLSYVNSLLGLLWSRQDSNTADDTLVRLSMGVVSDLICEAKVNAKN